MPVHLFRRMGREAGQTSFLQGARLGMQQPWAMALFSPRFGVPFLVVGEVNNQVYLWTHRGKREAASPVGEEVVSVLLP